MVFFRTVLTAANDERFVCVSACLSLNVLWFRNLKPNRANNNRNSDEPNCTQLFVSKVYFVVAVAAKTAIH